MQKRLSSNPASVHSETVKYFLLIFMYFRYSIALNQMTDIIIENIHTKNPREFLKTFVMNELIR